MVQFSIGIFAIAGTDQRQTMVIRIAAQKNHTAGHHLVRVDIGNFESQHLSVEFRGSFEIAYLQDDMADFTDVKIHAPRRREALQFLDIDGHKASLSGQLNAHFYNTSAAALHTDDKKDSPSARNVIEDVGRVQMRGLESRLIGHQAVGAQKLDNECIECRGIFDITGVPGLWKDFVYGAWN